MFEDGGGGWLRRTSPDWIVTVTVLHRPNTLALHLTHNTGRDSSGRPPFIFNPKLLLLEPVGGTRVRIYGRTRTAFAAAAAAVLLLLRKKNNDCVNNGAMLIRDPRKNIIAFEFEQFSETVYVLKRFRVVTRFYCSIFGRCRNENKI